MLDYSKVHLRGFKFADKLLCDYFKIFNAEQIMYTCLYVLQFYHVYKDNFRTISIRLYGVPVSKEHILSSIYFV